MSGFKCQECGKKFKTVKSAEKASMDGCPKCGGVDIDIDLETVPEIPTLDQVHAYENILARKFGS